MYYKIENKECEVYKKLHELRTLELQIGKQNEEAIKEKTGLDFENYLGHSGQQNFRRVPQYDGFQFTEPEKVDLKIWQTDKEHTDIFVPNRRTKVGREMDEFLSNGLKGSNFNKVFDILDLDYARKFTFPYVEICGELIVLYLSNDMEPKDQNIVEITKREFEQLLAN